MNRNIKVLYKLNNEKDKVLYKLNNEKDIVSFYITDESTRAITRYVKVYSLADFKGVWDVYNKLLDDCNAEYDNELAEVLEMITNQLEKEGVFNE